MSLSTAALVLLGELIVTAFCMVTTRSPLTRSTRLVALTKFSTVLSGFWAIGLAGTEAVRNQDHGTWVALGLSAINCIAYLTVYSARQRVKYGSNPA